MTRSSSIGDIARVDDLRGDGDAEHLAGAGGADPDHPTARHPLDLPLGGSLLGRHHLLRLLQQTPQAVGRDGREVRESRSGS